ncbi:MAG TPA: radical SAM protein, partial [Vicinamibacteria bacterium]|nr:radical SAM protein [Vicinamibacteria bacterium]
SGMLKRSLTSGASPLESEVPLQPIKQAGRFRVALCYPNLYFVGMSNLGFQAVYRLLNGTPDVVCERAFLPDDEDKAELERTASPLVSFESGTPLRDFDAVAFSVSFENDYQHVLQVLRLAGIPLRARDRGPRDPLVILGGAAMFLNPEPLAPFADLVAVGEGEPMVPRMMDALLGAADPRRGLEALQPKDGFYVPSRYEVRYHADGTVAGYDGPGRVTRQRGWPGAMGFPQSVILTPHTEMSRKYMVEISRGCPCMCRFCWAGYNYLPVRGFTRRDLVERAREVRRATGRIGLVSTAVCDHPEIDGIVDDLAAMDYEVSVASLRLDDLTPGFVLKLADTGVQGLTLAPECGSDRMRRILNKRFTNAEILDKATWIFENGILNLKLYYMVGLPFEDHTDVEAIVTLTERIRERMLEVARGRGRVGRLHPSVNPFVPKPGTPYQWLPMEDPKETDRKLQYLRKAFARMPNVDAILKSARTGAVQSVLAVADRRAADALEATATHGIDLKRALRDAGLDPAFYLFRGRARDEALPWDLVDNGVSKDYLWRELEKSRQERLSPHCPEIQGCIRCGVCVETPNPSYRLPEKWKALGAPPRYRAAGTPAAAPPRPTGPPQSVRFRQ